MVFHNKVGWLALGLIASSFMPGCVAASKYYQTVDELNQARDELAAAQSQLNQAEGALVDISNSTQMLEQRADMVGTLQAANAELQRQIAELNKEYRASTPEGWQTVINEAEGLFGYSATGDVLFAPGSDTLTTEGKATLSNLVPRLLENAESKPIRVVGHTDSDPVKKTIEKFPNGNIQLGAARAISVMKFLASKGVPETRLSVMSYGEHRPVQDSRSADAKRQNRRVEVMIEEWKPVRS